MALTETGPGGANTRTRLDYVVVSEAPPVAEFVGSPLTGPAPLQVDFTNQSTGAVTTHAWTFGDGGTSSAASPSHTYALPGVYTVELSETGPGGSDTRTRLDYVVVSEPPPVAQFFATPRHSRRVPLVVDFFDLSSGAVTSWSWDFGDGSVSSDPSPTHTYLANGLYTVTLTAAGPGGSDQEIKTRYIRVSAPRASSR